MAELIETLAEFARTLTHGYDIGDVLHDLSERVTHVLGISGAGVSIVKDDHLAFVTSNNETIATLERVQDEHQEGPCVDAARRGEVVAISDLAELPAGRWPRYRETARSLGFVAAAGIPLRADEESIGVLDLLDDTVHEWTEDDLVAARTLADVAASYLVHASELERQRRVSEQLERALETRMVIEQAKGILANANGVSIDEAFQILRRHARTHGANLHDVATAVVQLGLRL